MMRSTISRLMASVLSLGCLASLAVAQTGPTGPDPGPGTVPGQPAQMDSVLSMEGVVAYLKRLDPNMQFLGKNDTWTYYQFTLAGKGQSYKVRVAVNQGRVFLDCGLGQPIGSQGLSSEVMTKMLKLNASIGPSYFNFIQVKGGLQLVLSHCLDVRVTPARFQAGLNEFLGDILNSAPVWSEALNQTAGQQPAPAAPIAPRN